MHVKRRFFKACSVAVAFSPLVLLADIAFENDAFSLVVGDDAKTKSLVVKATGEETIDNGEDL